MAKQSLKIMKENVNNQNFEIYDRRNNQNYRTIQKIIVIINEQKSYA